MTAQVKTTTISSEQRKSIANEIFQSILMELKWQKDRKANVCECVIRLSEVGWGSHPFGTASLPTDYIDFSIKTNKKEFGGLGKWDVKEIGEMLCKLATEKARGVKAWNTLSVEQEEVFVGYGNFTPDFHFPSVFRYFAEPCAEFRRLNRLMEKYVGKTFGIGELYSVSLFGKRSQYGESGERHYYAYEPQICLDIIGDLKKARGKANKVTFKVEPFDDIDTEYSQRYETECHGSRTIFVEFVGTKPNKY